MTGGIRRKVDDLGRVVIPAGIRRALNLREGDAVEVTLEGDRVVLARPHEACLFCGREEGPLHAFRGRHVCGGCLGRLSEVALRAPGGDASAPPVAPGPGQGKRTSAPPPSPSHESRSGSAPAAAPRPVPGAVRLTGATGPIDGDALARGATAPSRRRRPPQEESESTTAW